MKDAHDREINYLRLSITERCNLKCVYCKPEDCPKKREMSFEGIERLLTAFAGLDFKKVRLTGGEPLVRRDLEDIVAVCSRLGYEDISVTTNGQFLKNRAAGLKAAGLKRVNISLDTLKPDRYRELTGGDIEPVLAGIDAALECGLSPVRVNAVLIRGKNDDEIDDLIALARRPIEVRFIELMPMGGMEGGAVLTDEILSARLWLRPEGRDRDFDDGGPAFYYRAGGYAGRVGFISPLTHKFCGDCNRVRVLADGKLRPCLGVNEEIELPVFDEGLKEVIRRGILGKPAGHRFEDRPHSGRGMSRIGG